MILEDLDFSTVDVMIGNEEDFTACLGFAIEGNDENLKTLNLDGYKKMKYGR